MFKNLKLTLLIAVSANGFIGVSSSANAQTTAYENRTVSAVNVVRGYGYFKTVELIENPSSCTNGNWYSLGRIGTDIESYQSRIANSIKFDMIRDARRSGDKISIIVDGCLGPYPSVVGVGVFNPS